MKSSSLRRTALPAVAILTVGLTLAACGDNSSSGGSTSGGGTLNGGGATSQANAQTVWRADYQKANGGTINYEEVGSGTGVTNFTSKAYSFAGTDAFLTDQQMTAAAKSCASDVVEVPAYVSPIAVAFNVPGVTSLNLDSQTIADIFNGKVTTWNDQEIASQNSGVKLPSTAITTVHRSDESGTTFNFTEYLNKTSAGAWPYPANTVVAGQGWSGRGRHLRCDRRAQRHGRRDRLRRRLSGDSRGQPRRGVDQGGFELQPAVRHGRRAGARGVPAGSEPAGDLDGHPDRPDGHGQG